MERVTMLLTSPVFRTFSRSELSAILAVGHRYQVGAGETIFKIGDPGDAMHVILEGSVELLFSPGLRPKVLGVGQVFGELSLIKSDHNRSATAVAKTDASLARIGRAEFEGLIRERPDLLMKLLRVVADYLLDSERKLVEDLTARNQELQRTLDYLQRTRQELDAQELLARTDQLTGLYNRRCFDEQIGAFLERSTSGGAGVALVLVDCDEFKEVNDRHGHPSGDAALRHVASVLREGVRKTDLPCRLGGDEFAILLLDIAEEDARRRAELVCETISGSSFAAVPSGEPLSITVSVGGAMHVQGESSADLLHRADRALYQAKEEGRNRLGWIGRPD